MENNKTQQNIPEERHTRCISSGIRILLYRNLTPLNKIRLALGAVDTDFSFSSGNPYLLAAAGALVDVELAGLGYLEFQVLPAFLNTEFQIQILLVLLEPFADIL